jgi:hypothetical protein
MGKLSLYLGPTHRSLNLSKGTIGFAEVSFINIEFEAIKININIIVTENLFLIEKIYFFISSLPENDSYF